MDTWGIPSSTFVALYAGVVAATAAIVALVRSRILSASVRDGLGGLRSAEIDPYEAAMLTGGGALALTTAVCRLSEAGSVRPSPDGRGLAVSGALPAAAHPIERWVYGRIGSGVRDAKSVLDEDAAASVLRPIRGRLWARGLLLEPRPAHRLRLQSAWFLPAVGVGLARLVAGLHNHRPVGFLFLLLAVAIFAAIALSRPPRATAAGTRTLKALTHDPASFGSFGIAGDVALGGAAALWAADTMLATTLGLKQGGGGFGGGAGGCGGGGCGGGCGG